MVPWSLSIFFFQVIFTFNIPSVRNVVAAIGWEILLSGHRDRERETKDNTTMYEAFVVILYITIREYHWLIICRSSVTPTGQDGAFWVKGGGWGVHSNFHICPLTTDPISPFISPSLPPDTRTHFLCSSSMTRTMTDRKTEGPQRHSAARSRACSCACALCKLTLPARFSAGA